MQLLKFKDRETKDDVSGNITRGYKRSRITSEDDTDSQLTDMSPHVSTTSGEEENVLSDEGSLVSKLSRLSNSSNFMEGPSPSTSAEVDIVNTLKHNVKRPPRVSTNICVKRRKGSSTRSVELPARPRPLSTQTTPCITARGRESPISTVSSSSAISNSPCSSQRHAVPMGKRRVYSCNPEYGTMQTERNFEGMTCMYENTLPKAREHLVKLPGVLPRYIVCLLEQTTYSCLDHIWEDVDKFLGQEVEVFNHHDNFEVVQYLMRLQRSVANCINFKIGNLINHVSENQQSPRHSIVCSICNEAGKAKERKYISLLTRCSQEGCTQCRSAQLFDSHGRNGPISVFPCVSIQACCRLLEIDYQNFTPTFFAQCADVASLPFYSPLVRSSEAPSCMRTAIAPMAPKAYKDPLRYQLPTLISGCVPVFSLSADKSAVEAVQYADGDGGYVVLEHFDLFKEYIHKLQSQLPMVFLPEHDYHMLPFREYYHDALELGHEYEITQGQQPPQRFRWGYEALVTARKHIAHSVRLWLVPFSRDVSGNRLLIELFTLEEGELTPKSTGVRLIEAGLSHLTANSPVVYKEAWSIAQRNQVGIHEYNLGSKSELHPMQLKESLHFRKGAQPTPPLTIGVVSQGETVICTVTNNPTADYLNEANIWVLKSTIQNAGLGLFLKPTLPSRCSISIPPNKPICVYSSEAIPTTDSQQFATTDYLIEVERRGNTVCYNPQAYNGRNIGRFTNQGGLIEGIREMCFCCNRKQGGDGIQQGRIHKAMAEKCNTAYRISSGMVLQVVALQRLESSNTPTELFVNYSFTYWSKYIASHHKELGLRNPVVSGFLWCYLSRHSVLYQTRDFDAINIPQEIISRFRDMECPFKQNQRRK